MNIKFVKIVTSTVVGFGTTQIVHGIVRHNTDPENIVDTVTITAGAVALGMMASRATRRFTDQTIDEIAEWYNENFKKTA
jgi:hypothetical protein